MKKFIALFLALATLALGQPVTQIGNGNVSGTLYFGGATTGGNVTGASGALSLTALGTNQNITLTPSGTGGVRINNTVGQNVAPDQNIANYLAGTVTGAVGKYGYVDERIAGSDVTSVFSGFSTSLGTQAAAFNLALVNHFSASGFSMGAGSSVTEQNGFRVGAGLNGATNNYGFRGLLAASGTSRWNLYMDGTAPNLLGGAVILPSTNTSGLQLYNTADQTTNYERLEALWSSNLATIRTTRGGTGTPRSLELRAVQNGIAFSVAGASVAPAFDLNYGSRSETSVIGVRVNGGSTATSGTHVGFSIAPTYNQASGIASNTDLLINRTETGGVGSGNQYLIQAQVGGSDRFIVTNSGSSRFLGYVLIGSVGAPSTNSRFSITGGLGTAAWGTAGIQSDIRSATFTDTSTAGSGTAATAVFTSFAQPTLAATNTSVTTTDAATVYIANAPAAGTNQTITNPYALWVDAGNTRLDGALITTPQALSGAGAVNLTTSATFYTSTGGAQALTLANGTAGQIKYIVHQVDGGSGVLTPSSAIGFTTITFTNVGDSVTLVYTAAGWAIVGIFGAVAA